MKIRKKKRNQRKVQKRERYERRRRNRSKEERKRKQENMNTQIKGKDGDDRWCISTVRGCKNQSGAKHSPNSPIAGGGVLHSSTQTDKVDGQKIPRKRDSVTGNHPRR